jgi:hypothetical protein
MKLFPPLVIGFAFLVFGVTASYLLPDTLSIFVRALGAGLAAGVGVWIALLILGRSNDGPSKIARPPHSHLAVHPQLVNFSGEGVAAPA